MIINSVFHHYSRSEMVSPQKPDYVLTHAGNIVNYGYYLT